jgi:hypothetical protein
MMSENKKAASGAGNTTGSKDNNSMASVAQPELKGKENSVNTAGQRSAIRMAYRVSEKKAHDLNDPKILSERVDTLVKQFAQWGFSREQIVAIGKSKGAKCDNDSDFFKPVPPVMERQHPTVWTPEEEKQLRIMKEKGIANSEICKQLHKTPQQVSNKWCFMRKAAEKVKKPAPEPEKPEPAPTSESAPQVKTVPEFDMTAVKQPISKHQSSLPYAALKEYRLFDLMQKIMAANRFTRLTLTAVNEHGTQYRAEVRKP